MNPAAEPTRLRFFDAEPPAQGERFDVLLQHGPLMIERIVSSSSIESQRYVQAQDEWVMLVQGRAVLDVAGQRRELVRGDCLFIPAGTPHTVLETDHGTLWLAVHWHAPIPPR